MDRQPCLTCRYIQDWTYVKALNRHIRRTDPKVRGFLWFWIVLLVFCVVLMANAGDLWWIDMCLAAFCVYRAFCRNWIRMRISWKRTCTQTGTDRINTTIQFGESIIARDDSGVMVDIPWTNVKKMQNSGAYFELFNGPARQNCIYVPKEGFEDGAGRAFWDWVGQEHPEIERAIKKK